MDVEESSLIKPMYHYYTVLWTFVFVNFPFGALMLFAGQLELGLNISSPAVIKGFSKRPGLA